MIGGKKRSSTTVHSNIAGKYTHCGRIDLGTTLDPFWKNKHNIL